MSGGFGTSFGAVPFGGAIFDLLPLSFVQLAANLVAATVSGDAAAKLIPKNWTVTPLDPDAHPRLVQSAQDVNADNEGSFDIPQLVLVQLPITLLAIDGVLSYGKRYRISFGGADFDFTALKASATAAPADIRTDSGFLWDIANPYSPRDALVFPAQLGTYQVTAAGDLGTDKTGEAGLRKRIVRRVFAASGSFFHLLGYGAGVQVKGLLTVDMLRRLSARIRPQVLQEPEVQTCTCRLSQTPQDPSVVSCVIDAVTSAGAVQTVVPIRLP
jgi:hypothetical protein